MTKSETQRPGKPRKHAETDTDSLRSPRMRRLLGGIPGHLTAWLVIMSLLIFAGVALAAALIPYPHSHGESILRHLL